jgi:hypothetical protein
MDDLPLECSSISHREEGKAAKISDFTPPSKNEGRRRQGRKENLLKLRVLRCFAVRSLLPRAAFFFPAAGSRVNLNLFELIYI